MLCIINWSRIEMFILLRIAYRMCYKERNFILINKIKYFLILLIIFYFIVILFYDKIISWMNKIKCSWEVEFFWMTISVVTNLKYPVKNNSQDWQVRLSIISVIYKFYK